MTTDLFLDKKSKREMLLDWIIEYLETHNWLRTSQIIAWGTKNFSNRADRDARQLCSEGRFRRMTEEEKKANCLYATEDFYVPNDFQ